MKRIANLKNDHYVIWDTTFDAPITKIMTYSEMEAEIKSWSVENFDQSMNQKIFLKLLENAKMWGVSTQLVESNNPIEQVIELISGNRAGEDEEEITLEQIVLNYSK
jgi:hypothetical protein